MVTTQKGGIRGKKKKIKATRSRNFSVGRSIFSLKNTILPAKRPSSMVIEPRFGEREGEETGGPQKESALDFWLHRKIYLGSQ